jgi:hypothetical protein
LTIAAPLVGCIGCLIGSAKLLKSYSDLNVSIVLVTLPLLAATNSSDLELLLFIISQLLLKAVAAFALSSIVNSLENLGFQKF